MRIRWTMIAASDLEQMAAYIVRDNPNAARSVIQAITDGIATLKISVSRENRARGRHS